MWPFSKKAVPTASELAARDREKRIAELSARLAVIFDEEKKEIADFPIGAEIRVWRGGVWWLECHYGYRQHCSKRVHRIELKIHCPVTGLQTISGLPKRTIVLPLPGRDMHLYHQHSWWAERPDEFWFSSDIGVFCGACGVITWEHDDLRTTDEPPSFFALLRTSERFKSLPDCKTIWQFIDGLGHQTETPYR